MTIDIEIGKLRVKSFKEVMKDKLDQWTFTHKNTFNITDFLVVEQCPDEPDGCTEEDTIFPNSAYRSGSNTAISDFFKEVMPKIIREMKPIESNDFQISRINPFLEEINKLQYNGKVKQHKIRLHWFKFWCNKAVELYGDEAVVSFS